MTFTFGKNSLPGWAGAVVRPVLDQQTGHTFHSYFNHCPESPDGRWVLLFVSGRDDAQQGNLVVVERSSGSAFVLAENIAVEDAHRQACQQWVDGGKSVVFHHHVQSRWQVERVDIATRERHVLVHGRLLGWSQPDAPFALLYGPHWSPGEHRHLEKLDIQTGQVSVLLPIEHVTDEPALRAFLQEKYPDGSDEQLSIFFPILSPDHTRVFFKLSRPTGRGYQDPKASERHGLIVWDLLTGQLVAYRSQWGHPSWHPDSRRIVETMNVLLDDQTLQARPIHDLPDFRGTHPSVSPDARWFTTDAIVKAIPDDDRQWGIVIADMTTGQWGVVSTAPAIGHGTTSWRKPHPHPVFNAKSNRLYFNLNMGSHVTLRVLEKPDAPQE